MSDSLHPTLDSFERIETSFAFIYRSREEVFKIRKPVALRLGDESIDLSTIEQRRLACLHEAGINQRLAPDYTLGVVPVNRGADDRLGFGTEGETTDWALHMRRLPDDDRADQRLDRRALGDDHLRSVAHHIARFHERAKIQESPVSSGVLDRLRAQINMRVEAKQASPMTPHPDTMARVAKWQLDFLEAQSDRFMQREATDSIREGHGELSLGHIFLDDVGGVHILAGLEMGPGLRDADVVADVALLMADLGFRHRVDLAERFVSEYAGITNDFDLYPLLDFYASLRAAQRGKIDWFSADQATRGSRTERTYRERAQRFFALALAAPRRPLLPPVVVAMGGQVASGKSTVARHIAQRIGAPVVGSDPTRDFLLGARVNEDLHEARWEESYEPGFGARVYAEVLRRAEAVLVSGRPVVIDGCFRSRLHRNQARELADRFGRPFLFAEATVAEDVQLARLSERAVRDSVPIEAWKEIADQLRLQWEPADDLSEDQHLRLDTALPLEHNADAIEDRLPTWPREFTG